MRLLLLLFVPVLLLGMPTAGAQTKFIQYKNYLIPIETSPYSECVDGKPRIIVTTDMNGLSTTADPDDLQSMVHLLASSNRVVIKGIISTPFTSDINVSQEKEHIVNLIRAYEYDYNRSNPGSLSSLGYPSPSDLFSVVRQGVMGRHDTIAAPFNAAEPSHQGAKLILDEAQSVLNGTNCGPLHVLVWGAIPDLTLALKESDRLGLGIEKALRVYFIGSTNRGIPFQPNGNQAKSFNEIKTDFLDLDRLWFILSDSTFAGTGFVNTQVQKNFLDTISKDANTSSQSCMSYVLRRAADAIQSEPLQAQFWLKMGDSPSLFHLLDPSWSLDNSYPTSSNWGGQYSLRTGKTQWWSDGAGASSVLTHMVPSVYPDWKVSMDRFTKFRGSGCINAVSATVTN